MTNRYSFDEVVIIVSENDKLKEVNNSEGVIKGMVFNKKTREWIYGVAVNNQDGMIWRVKEDEIRSLGKMAAVDQDYYNLRIKVRVNPKTGEGEIIEK